MGWAKFDDSFYDHPKIMKVLDECPMGMVLHVRAVTYCARHATDGQIRKNVVDGLVPLQRDREQQVAVLIDSGMWYDHDGSYWLHDYLDYNPSKKQILERQEKDRVRKGKGKDDG